MALAERQRAEDVEAEGVPGVGLGGKAAGDEGSLGPVCQRCSLG